MDRQKRTKQRGGDHQADGRWRRRRRRQTYLEKADIRRLCLWLGHFDLYAHKNLCAPQPQTRRAIGIGNNARLKLNAPIDRDRERERKRQRERERERGGSFRSSKLYDGISG
jgi:hypothetical protein